MRFNEEQQQAMDKIEKWLKSSEKEFRLGGLAGTGKTSLAGEIIKRNPNALVAAFTGKAASRLREKGATNAVTLHKAFKEFVRKEDGNPIFRNSEKTYGLAIIDEASMVSTDFYNQAIQRCQKVLWIGDHGQLPPYGSDSFCAVEEEKLDAKLTEIMRTGPGSGIPVLAKWLRHGKPDQQKENIAMMRTVLEKGCPNGVYVRNGYEGIAKIAIQDECFPVVVATHESRHMVNQEMRRLKEKSADRTEIGEPMICIANRPYKGIMNGEIFHTTKHYRDDLYCIKKETADCIEHSIVCIDHQFGPYPPRDSSQESVPCVDAYAITCHKAQGSEWDHVAVLINGAGFCRDPKWLYTAITRASEKVTIIFC